MPLPRHDGHRRACPDCGIDGVYELDEGYARRGASTARYVCAHGFWFISLAPSSLPRFVRRAGDLVIPVTESPAVTETSPRVRAG